MALLSGFLDYKYTKKLSRNILISRFPSLDFLVGKTVPVRKKNKEAVLFGVALL